MSAPTVGTVTTATAGGSGTSFSFSHANDGNLLLVCVSAGYYSTGLPTGITYNGVALTNLTSESSGSARSAIWYLKSPAAGSNTVSVTISGDGAFGVGAVSIVSADLVTTFGTPATGAGYSTAPTASVATTTTDDLVVGNVATRNTTIPGDTLTLSGTSLYNTNTVFGLGETFVAGQSKAGTGSAVAMGATISTSLDWSVCAVAIAGAAGGGSSIAAISSGYHQRGLR